MNTEQKQAIAIFERAMRLRDPALLTPECCEIALEALREKAEREKGCAFCNTGAHRILQNALYCPRCGKRLEVEP